MSIYRGVVRKFGRKYIRASVSRATNKDGVTACPICNCSTRLLYDGEHIQLGLWGTNVYHEFYSCEECETRFCIIMKRKAEDYYGK